jgi:hypothetical protein
MDLPIDQDLRQMVRACRQWTGTLTLIKVRVDDDLPSTTASQRSRPCLLTGQQKPERCRWVLTDVDGDDLAKGRVLEERKVGQRR